ncbi:MAG TPA: phenylalanine--tRNA ligase subunit beta [Chthoniobacterales bacterium]|jgi:phenylalanyl-tRNA synthetase beta chain
MKVSLNWLREFLPLDKTNAEISDLLTFAGVEVEGIETKGVDIANVVVGQIQSSEQHPNADRLSVCKVDDGSGMPRQIVCGAKNYQVGDKIPVALPGAVLPGDFKIKVGKLRGVESEGMMCSAKELGISEESAGLLILSPESAIGTPISALFPSDTIFDLEITPNRPDLLSHSGIARELGAILGAPVRGGMVAESLLAGNFPVQVESDSCPFYSARIVRNVKVGPSPEWLVAKLQSVGLRSINNVVDITNFVMLEMGQPLHAFDLAKVDRGIVVRQANAQEKFLALDGREYTLTAEDLVIADETRALAIAGVMGGQDSGVSASTTDVLLESALFRSSNIRRTSRVLGLSSDSSYRFERGVDAGQVLAASARACQLLAEIAGGQAEPALSVAGQLPPLQWTVSLRNDRCRQLLGADLPDGRIDGILSGLGLTKAADGWTIPSFRADLTREVDLIEEIARVHGIQAIPAKSGGFAAPTSEVDRLYDFQMSLKRALAARGFSEARTLSLRPANETALRTDAALRVRNPLTEDQTWFRESLLAGLLTVAEFNQRMGATSIRLLETGRTFRQTDVSSEETLTLGLLITGQDTQSDWRKTSQPLDFFGLKADVSHLVAAPLVFVASAHPAAVLAADISIAGKKVGWIGQLQPALVRDTGLKAPVYVAEIDLNSLLTALPTNRLFSALPKYPAVTRDIAMLAPQTLTHAEIEAALVGANDPLLRDVSIFDIFTDATGTKIPADKKSLAYSLTYRADDRTLTQDEVNAAHARLKTRLVETCGVTLRE